MKPSFLLQNMIKLTLLRLEGVLYTPSNSKLQKDWYLERGIVMEKQKTFHVAVVGATGAVGEQMLNTLEKREFPIGKLTLLSSKRSAGKKLVFKGEEFTVQEATPESFEGVDIALFSAGGSVSKQLAPEAAKRGAIVVDNTSAFRMTENVPLVVPEVNLSLIHI